MNIGRFQRNTSPALEKKHGSGGANLEAMLHSFRQQARQAQAAGPGPSPGTPGSGLTTEQVAITCPSGVSSTVPITYRTRACFEAARQFAVTYACNRLDQARVMQNCTNACGHPQCLQK
jgi:hypothetical protein